MLMTYLFSFHFIVKDFWLNLVVFEFCTVDFERVFIAIQLYGFEQAQYSYCEIGKQMKYKMIFV